MRNLIAVRRDAADPPLARWVQSSVERVAVAVDGDASVAARLG
jgi:hypothetical protein